MPPKSNWKEWSERSSAIDPVFRGGIIENSKRFQLRGDRYKSMPAEQNGYFDISTARHMAGPLAALTHPGIRRVHECGATQVMKSMAGDLWVPYVLEHLRGPMLVLFEDDPKADLFASSGLMETLRKHPGLSKMLGDATRESRHNVQGTWIKTLFSQLLVAGLNDGNVSSLSWQFVWISESWQHGNDGLLKKAIKRTDRFPDTHKILNESQASVAGTDLHEAVKDVQQVPLTWACPACDGRQTWEWKHWSYQRPSDFKPRPRKGIFLTAGGIQIESEAPKPGTYAGMRFPDDEKLSLVRRAERAYWECLWCGYHIEDRPEVRRQLADSYRQVFWTGGGENDAIPEDVNLLPAEKEVCFVLPFEANMTNKFASTVLSYLKADRAKREGNEIPLQDWFLAERAVFYAKGQTLAIELAPVIGSYNPDAIPDQHSANMMVDCQKALDAGPDEDRMGSFWVTVHAWNKRGDSFQLFRGFCISIEEVLYVKKHFGIANGRFCMDGRKWTTDILDLAAIHFENVEKVWMGRKYPAKETWRILLGDDAAYYKWSVPGQKAIARTYSPPHPHQRMVQINGRRMSVTVNTYLWSNLAIGDQVHQVLLDTAAKKPGAIHVEILSHWQLQAKAQGDAVLSKIVERTIAKETEDYTWEKQINSEFRDRSGKRPKWVKKPQAQNHYLDLLRIEHCRKHQDGLAGGIIEDSAVDSSPE